MKTRQPKAGTSYSATAKVALQQGAARVEEMHRAIADTTFSVLTRLPVIGAPAEVVRKTHDRIKDAVYATLHHGGGGLLDLADSAEKHYAARSQNDSPPSRLANSLRSAVNGAFGDHLAEIGSRLAIDMAIYHQAQALPLQREALAKTWPQARQRLCLFLHGLGCNESCWETGSTGLDLPRQVENDCGCNALSLRYNTGRPIDENGAELADLLETLLSTWPQPVRELVLIGHSMGGLLARSAFAEGRRQAMSWPKQTRMIICIGSPHLGSPVERLGQLTTQALQFSSITEPLARVARKRSQGIQDLRHGPGPYAEDTTGIAWRFIGGTLSEDPENAFGRLFGDGLVTPDSATAHEQAGDVASVRLGKVGHMSLLNDRRVHAQIITWLGSGKAQ